MTTPNSALYDELVLTVQRCIERAEDRLQKFALDLQESAFSAMEWSHAAFEAATHAAVYRQLMRELRAEQPETETETESDRVSRLTRRCQREVNQRVRSPVRSTSPTAVLANQELVAAWGSALQLLMESGL